MRTRAMVFGLGAVALAVLINLGLFGIASVLSQERALQQDITAPLPVHLIHLPAEEIDREEVIEEIKPPEPVPTPDFTPDLRRSSLTLPPMPAVSVAPDFRFLENSGFAERLIFDAAELDQPPQAIVRTEPPYPYRAQQLEIEGFVQVRLLVAEDGSVNRVSVLVAEPAGVFEESVLQMVPTWRFNPGKVAGHAVASWVISTIAFELH